MPPIPTEISTDETTAEQTSDVSSPHDETSPPIDVSTVETVRVDTSAQQPTPPEQPTRVLLSIIVPVFNEDESLGELYRQITEVAAEGRFDLELIFIDDGSTDGSWNRIDALAAHDTRVKAIRFRRNFGKAAALTAGMRSATGDLILMMDADLQDDPAEIPGFLDAIAEGFDVVNGWKKHRLDPWHKVYPSKVFNWLVSKLSGLKLSDHNCGLKLFRREVAEEVRIYGELHRFIPVLAHKRGFKVTQRAVHHRPRQHGHSKYGVRRFLRGLLDLTTVTFLTSFRQRPAHFLGGVGLFFVVLGGIGLTYLGVLWMLMNVAHVVTPTSIGTRPLLAYSVVSTLLGAQALSLGLLAELFVANTTREADWYSVRQRINLRDEPESERLTRPALEPQTEPVP